ncbi:cornifin-B-like isoform X3 [Canis lupus familiaris]|uniref:cornifin-B-like isoform X3 n=1 Tax=Canis lupus familiaris TaxID=9615 RepID=UPI0006B3DBF0|nr:cornifin-B-like isoform X3 [Canis lupus familiaris]XP_038511059.1 cornifin-B-like isoform X3 [Canis lupus familiaris]|eukprot:XP_013971669.1 cornifin-B-like isoform X2 [Canis lupus familiaris]
MPCCHAALRGLPPFHAAALPPCSPAALVGLQPCRPAAWLLSDPERPAALPQCFPAALPPCCPAALPPCFSAALLPCCPAALPPCEACSPVRCVTHPAFKVSEQTLDPDLTGRCLLRPPLTCRHYLAILKTQTVVLYEIKPFNIFIVISTFKGIDSAPVHQREDKMHTGQNLL